LELLSNIVTDSYKSTDSLKEQSGKRLASPHFNRPRTIENFTGYIKSLYLIFKYKDFTI